MEIDLRGFRPLSSFPSQLPWRGITASVNRLELYIFRKEPCSFATFVSQLFNETLIGKTKTRFEAPSLAT